MSSVSVLTTVSQRCLQTISRRTCTNSISTTMSTFSGAKRFATTYYTKAHEYITVEGTNGTVGITDFAQSALGDIVYVDLPAIGTKYEKGESFGSVESVKAASDVYVPVSGTVKKINDTISSDPGLVNTNAEDTAWFIKIKISDTSELSTLMDSVAYKEHCEKEAH